MLTKRAAIVISSMIGAGYMGFMEIGFIGCFIWGFISCCLIDIALHDDVELTKKDEPKDSQESSKTR